MKYLVLVILMVFATSYVFAEGKVEERKAKVSAHIDKKISTLNEFKTCVSTASKKGDIKACRTAHKTKMSALKAERKAMRKGK